MSINVVILEGNLGEDPQFINLKNGSRMARLNMAINSSWKDKSGNWQSKVSWTQLTCYVPHTLEKIDKLKKGAHIIIEGQFGTNEWTSKEGVKHNDPCIKINEIKEILKTFVEETADENNIQQENEHQE